MKGLQQIQSENREAAERVQEEGIEPLLITERSLSRLRKGMISQLQDIPFVGDAFFEDYNETSRFFVDSSGFGSPGEPALTIKQFVNLITPERYYAITSIGQFQINIQEYEKE